ncbi:MAG: hypothetical protein ABI904_17430 [Chloroflexota bacterium]
MKHNPLLSLIAESFDNMFVADKHGKMVFFPWGSNKPGYFIKSKNTVEKVKKFYRLSFFICLTALGITISFFHDFWAIVISMVIFLGGWYLVYSLYTSRVTRNLLPAKTSYKDIVLEKIEPEDVEDEIVSGTQFHHQWDKPIPQTKNDPFLGIKRFWYRLSPAQLFMLYFFSGIFILITWTSYQPKVFGENQFDYLVGSFAFFLWGLSGFVVARNMESSKADLWGFLNWKLPMILIAVACWALAVLSLYKFAVILVSTLNTTL